MTFYVKKQQRKRSKFYQDLPHMLFTIGCVILSAWLFVYMLAEYGL